jgi:hypothetical protein
VSQPNYAGNIIIVLANLPDFLRKPILTKRLEEFFTLSAADKLETINNALEAGPTIPFSNFAKLFATWLQVLAGLSEEKRTVMFSAYISEILKNPQKLVLFNLDGILEIFLSLDQAKKEIIANSIRQIISKLTYEEKRRLFLIIPQNAKTHLGI